MIATSRVSYRIDSLDRVSSVGDGWVPFARENGGERVLPPGVLGTSLWSWVGDGATRQIYQSLLGRVRTAAATARFQFRCDSPEQRRLLQMQIAAAGRDAVEFRTELLVSQQRAAVGLMAAAAGRSDTLLRICGWCMRVPVAADMWVEVEEAIAALRLFEASAPPQLSHGMCPRCHDTMLEALDDEELAASGHVTVGALPTND